MPNTFGIAPLIPGLVNEVALEIFRHFVAIDWDGPFTLVLVCTSWRDLVLRSTSLKSLRRDRRRPNPALMENRENAGGICIVSFDGGGPDSMSQLRILDELMTRLSFESNVEADQVLPAEYFDLMSGVGFGGFVALLLGRLRMTTTQAMEELASIGTETFPKGDELVTTEVTMARLRKAIEIMLERHGHSVDIKLRDSSGNRCKVVLFAATTDVMDHCHPFRTYRSPRKCLECTLVDAACATMATPEHFSSVVIGPRLRKQCFAGIPYGFDNPMREVIKEAQLVFGEKKPVSLVLSLGSGQTAQLSGRHHHVARWRRVHCDGVARDLQYQLRGFEEYLRLDVDKGMETIEPDDWHKLGSIESHTDVYLAMNPITKYIDKAFQRLLNRNGSITLSQLSGTSTDCVVKFPPDTLKKYLAMEFKQMHDVIQQSGIAKITLVDAIGNDIPIPTQFCVTYTMLSDLISLYFKHQKAPGSDFVERGDYRLVHGNHRNVVGAIEWTGIEKVGLKVEMSMILWTRNEDKERCPRCLTRFEGCSVDGWAQCLSCTGHFQVETQVQPETEDQSSDDTAQSEGDPLLEPSGVIPAMNGSKSIQPKMRKRKDNGGAMKLQFRLISVINLLEITASQSPELADKGCAPPDPFRPTIEGRLFTAHDSIVGTYCSVHPTARFLYDSLPPKYREVFRDCPMYPEKHLEFVKFLKKMSKIDITKMDANPGLLRPLGIQIPTEEGDKKKWQCPVVGCAFKDTLQHLYTHLQQKKHINLPMFACHYCKKPFGRFNDRNQHEMKIHGNASSPHTGSSRSTEHDAVNQVRQVPAGKTRTGKDLNRPERPPAYTDAVYDGDISMSADSDAPSSERDYQFSTGENPWSSSNFGVFHDTDANKRHRQYLARPLDSEGVPRLNQEPVDIFLAATGRPESPAMGFTQGYGYAGVPQSIAGDGYNHSPAGNRRPQAQNQLVFTLPDHQNLEPASSSNGLMLQSTNYGEGFQPLAAPLVELIQSTNSRSTHAQSTNNNYHIHNAAKPPQSAGDMDTQPLLAQWSTNLPYSPIYSQSHNYSQASALSKLPVYAAPAPYAPSGSYYFYDWRRGPTNDTMYDLKQRQTAAAYPNLPMGYG